MIRWAIRIAVIVASPAIGWFQIAQTPKGILVGVGCALLIIFAEIVIERIPLDNLVVGGVGAVVGWFVSKAFVYFMWQTVHPDLYDRIQKYSLLLDILLAYLFMVVFIRKKDEVDLLERNIFVPASKKKGQEAVVLDTSIIIDGRIIDVCETHFMTGRIIVPRFVLNELHALADSSDNIKRQKGRRGLDILARIQEIPETPVTIFDKDYPEMSAVDAKLVALAKELGGKIVTTDFNLNKIASLQGIRVLNINDLANALKAVVLPGESMNVFIVKDGKEKDQGVVYLDDGTMVIVEEGRRLVGKKAEVMVTSILQTSAGRMVFTRPKEHGQVSEPTQPPPQPRPNNT